MYFKNSKTKDGYPREISFEEVSRKLGKLQLQVRKWKLLAAIETSIEQDCDAYRGRSMLSTVVVKLKLC